MILFPIELYHLNYIKSVELPKNIWRSRWTQRGRGEWYIL